MLEIDKKLMKAAKMTQRVANEVQVHWQLHHSAILELYNYFEDQNFVYLVTELCSHGELFHYMQQCGGRFTEAQTRSIMSQVIQGLDYLHSHSILHRDLKLSNILLNDQLDCVSSASWLMD